MSDGYLEFCQRAKQEPVSETTELLTRIAMALESLAAELEAMNATLWGNNQPANPDLGERIAAAHAKREDANAANE